MDENALSFKEKGILTNMRSLLTKRSRSKSFLTPTQTPNNSFDMKGRLSLSPQVSNSLAPPPPSSNFLSIGRGRNQYLSTSTGNLTEESSLDSGLSFEVTPMTNNFKSVDYVVELHREIERLKTEKLILLRNSLENQEKLIEMRRKQEELERNIMDANREMKLLKIGKKQNCEYGKH